MLKDQPYVELAYMTGVLPISKNSSTSKLDMFQEYRFMNDVVFEEYFGYTEDEVIKLCHTQKGVCYDELKFWYDGYDVSNGKKLFSPVSVNYALLEHGCLNYWTRIGPLYEIADFAEHNIEEVREDIVKLISEVLIEIELQGYSAVELQQE